MRWGFASVLLGIWLAACARPGPTGSATNDTAAGSTKPDTNDAAVADGIGDATIADAKVADGAAGCPGGPRCPCSSDKDCKKGLCIEDRDSRACSQPCQKNAECLKSEGCLTLSGAGDAVCAPRFASLCAPCNIDADCQADGNLQAGATSCAVVAPYRKACVASCSSVQPCPDDFVCVTGQGCLPMNSAACTCSAWAVNHAMQTSCLGGCGGSLSCASVGQVLSCAIKNGKPELCNKLDDNCDGQTDEGEVCCACGDGACSFNCGETGDNCGVDCAPCGDGLCTSGETPEKCPVDCCGGCGDGKCLLGCGEDAITCPPDCTTGCGNGKCEGGENPQNCPIDCAKFACGNATCDPGENPQNCPADCGSACGNCTCENGEDPISCPADCGYCGDGVCSNCGGTNSEAAGNCLKDCGNPP